MKYNKETLLRTLHLLTGKAYADMSHYLTLAENMRVDLLGAIEDLASELGVEPNNLDWDNIDFESDVVDRALYHKLIFEHDLGGNHDVADLLVSEGEGMQLRYVDGEGNTLADWDSLYSYIYGELAVKVVFRYVTYPDGSEEVLAVFPDQPFDSSGNGRVNCYSRLGQHSSADLDYIYSISRCASIGECKGLEEELRNIGYLLEVFEYQD